MDKEFIENPVEAYGKLKQENEDLKAELKNFRDMAKKGLDEFKDVGGCWGCGLQLQLHQDIEDFRKLIAENEELKVYKSITPLKVKMLVKTLAEIKEIAEPYQKDIQNICSNCNNYDDCHACCKFDLNCYQYKKGDTKACDKFIELKKFEINNLANKILQKISEVQDD